MAKPENIEPLQLKESTLNGGTSKRVFPATYAKCVKVVVKVSDGSDGAVDLQTYLENLRQKIEEMGGGDIDIDMSDYPTQDDLQKAIDKAKDDMAGDMAEKAKEAVDDLVDKGDIIDRDTADDLYLKKADAERIYATKDELSQYLTLAEILELIHDNMQGLAPDGDIFLTKEDADNYYAPKGNYLTDADLSGYVTSSTLNDYATKSYVDNMERLTSDDIANFKTEAQIRSIITGYGYVTKTDADTYYPTKTEFTTLKNTVDGWNTNMTEVTNLSNKFETGFSGVANAVLYCNNSGKITANSNFTYNSLVSAPGFKEN